MRRVQQSTAWKPGAGAGNVYGQDRACPEVAGGCVEQRRAGHGASITAYQVYLIRPYTYAPLKPNGE